MVHAQLSPSQSENGDRSQTSNGYLERLQALLPQKRKPKFVWIILCSFVALGTLVYALVFNTEAKFYEDNDLCTKRMQSNTSTDTCYRKVEKKTHPVIVNIGLGLLGIIFGHFIYCLCNIIEELRQLKRRYNKSICKLLEQCMMGIRWKTAFIAGVIDFIAVGLAKDFFSFEHGDLLYIFGGLGLSPVFLYFLEQDSQTGVDHSRYLEGHNLHPAHALAKHYYTHHVKKVLRIFNKRFTDHNILVQDQEGSSDQDTQPKIQLSSKKLVLLISPHYKKDVMLDDLDSNISEIKRISQDRFQFPLYNLKHAGKEYQLVIQWVDKPLETLQIEYKDELEEQVKFLCKELLEMLMKDGFYSIMCTFVLITDVKGLQNGGLAKKIVSSVEESCKPNTNNCTTTQQQPQETGNNTSNPPCKSHALNIEDSNIEQKDQEGTLRRRERRDKNVVTPNPAIRNNREMKCKSSGQHETTPLVSPTDLNNTGSRIQ